MDNNFSFLEKLFPVLEKHCSLAENYLYSDPNTCIYKLGIFAETVIDYMFNLDKLTPPDSQNDTTLNRIKMMKIEGLLPKDIEDILHQVRTMRNKAVHAGHDSLETAKALLKMSHSLAVWFMQTYGDWQFSANKFILPSDNQNDKSLELLQKENEELSKKLSTLEITKQLSSVSDKTVTMSERSTQANTAANNMKLTEAETRLIIDEQLRKVGWEVDSINLHYSKGTRPQKGKNLAIAEWQTDSKTGNHGRVDYALFVGLQLVAIVEAKRAHTDVSSVIDNQCRDYATNIKAEHDKYCISKWGYYKIPFVFATNSRPYLKQFETKSGIWFRDTRDEANISIALQGWISPEGLIDKLEKDIEAANKKLSEMPTDLLTDKAGLNLRPYQVKAIEKAENAVIEGRTNLLLSMATGTGKTRTILGLIYRFLKTGRFKRILFLVDRTSLGEQTQDVFKEVKLEDLMTLNDIYDIKNLDDKDFDKETKVHVATVQSLVKRIIYNDEDKMLSVTDYDCIVIDEAHRGYILDKEMGGDELLYRSQLDYVSKYRTVIEFFDAVKIAITATPALHTTEIFGKPIFNYSYREAVIEGYLVDHDVPHDIKTKLGEEGIKFEKGDIVPIYNPVTGEITNSDELEDEIKFDIETFNRQVITENFNRAVLEEIAIEINPEGDSKTLIYAVDDSHADLIVKLLREIYEKQGVGNDAIMKITGSIGGGNKKKVLEAIKRFKNEKHPNIAVTVDLLTTGIDVPEISTLVFMRRVKSRILFEQMLGRATRLCPEINKTHFEIFDPVRVYEALEKVNTMKPVAVSESATFEDLLNGLNTLEEDAQVKNQINLIIAKMQRKKRNMSEKAQENFISLSGGMDVTQFINKVTSMKLTEAKEYLLKNKQLLEILNEPGTSGKRHIIISDKEDKVTSHTRGYGDGKNPQDYLDEFNSFITDNINTIAALQIVCTRPKELTRESLKHLKLELDRHNFTEQHLNTAWREWTNEDITADIISFIRRSALGIDLLNHEERIQRAVEKLIKSHSFSKIELDWLERIKKALIAESVLDRDIFETGAFKTSGGFKQIDKKFNGKLDDIIQELNDYLYDDGGKTA